MKNYFYILAILMVTACGGSEMTNGTAGKVDNSKLEKVEGQFCSVGQKLREKTNTSGITLNRLGYETRIVAFVDGQKSTCIASGVIREDNITQYGSKMWFSLNPNTENNCLQNQSLWEITGSHVSGQEQFYFLRNVDATNGRVMQMSGHQLLPATHLQKSIGLRLFSCAQ